MTTTALVHAHRERYLDLAGRSEIEEAVELCLSLLDRGATAEDITVGLLGPAQREVGERWALGAWSVAQEHAASAVTDAALAAISAAVPTRTTGGLVVVACPPGEWHVLAGRMVTQLLRWAGVSADYTGPIASDAALEELLIERQPRVLALSCTMTSQIPAVAHTVDVAARHHTGVLGGGRAFGPGGRYAQALGLTAWEDDVPRVVHLLQSWDAITPGSAHHATPEPLAYHHLLRHRDDIAGQLAHRVGTHDADAASQAVLSDAIEQVTALALAAARIQQPAILTDGLADITAALAPRGGPLAAAAAQLPAAARAVLRKVA